MRADPQQVECSVCRGTGKVPATAPIEAQEDDVERRMATLEKRVELLEGHVHQATGIPGEFTDIPLVEGEDNEGRAIWKSI